jgi:hypothetical protein
MKTAIIGSRNISNFAALDQVLKGLPITEVVSGGAAGVDTLAEQWAKENKKPITIIKPDYSQYGKQATMVRNAEIVKQAEQVIAFWDGESPGTKATIEMARKAGKLLKVEILRSKPQNQLDLF